MTAAVLIRPLVLRAPAPPACPPAEGLQTVRTAAFALWLIVVVAMVEFTYGAQTVQLVVYARQSLGLGTGGYSVLLTAAGAGGLVSAFINGGRRSTLGRDVTLVAGVLVRHAVLAAGASMSNGSSGGARRLTRRSAAF